MPGLSRDLTRNLSADQGCKIPAFAGRTVGTHV